MLEWNQLSSYVSVGCNFELSNSSVLSKKQLAAQVSFSRMRTRVRKKRGFERFASFDVNAAFFVQTRFYTTLFRPTRNQVQTAADELSPGLAETNSRQTNCRRPALAKAAAALIQHTHEQKNTSLNILKSWTSRSRTRCSCSKPGRRTAAGSFGIRLCFSVILKNLKNFKRVKYMNVTLYQLIKNILELHVNKQHVLQKYIQIQIKLNKRLTQLQPYHQFKYKFKSNTRKQLLY
ncbi:Hypothetical_protein [Hexamita inflata]|uniref:Hypothetical_protein n=1 Tax=Hexamita inflata TaxID=28002 RepID=A0ABP1KYA7_9EUKA